ncbi:MAG: hypothetical protein J5I98_17965 [Phaeodactylibacter sp.]|nr:hypothetical protein [Phaeodactylibacter sp.]
MKTDTSRHAGETTPLPSPSRPADSNTRNGGTHQTGKQSKFNTEKTAIGCSELSPG